jgi:site-specific DNA recombinase
VITREAPAVRTLRCAVYTRKSTEKGLEQDFNSLDAQREACEAYIASQRHEGWVCLREQYDDGGFSGGNLDRPALQRLIHNIEKGEVDAVIVYKIDRISRSLLDFAKLMELFEKHGVAFTSITQQFSTTTAMGRLTLNILLSFAEFERAIISERVRDKIAAAKKKGIYMGGTPPFGYDVDYTHRRLVVNPKEAEIVRWMFNQYLLFNSLIGIAKSLNAKEITTKTWTTKSGKLHQGSQWTNQHVYRVLTNCTFRGLVEHEGEHYKGEHEAIIDERLWDEVQRTLTSGLGRQRKQPTRETNALLHKLIRCGHCGKAMTHSYTRRRGKLYRYYVCGTAAKLGYDACPIRTVPAGDIETAVLDHLRTILSSPELVAQTFRVMQDQNSGALDSAGTELSEHDVAGFLTTLDTVWNELYPAEQYRVMRALVDQVVVTEGGIDMTLRADGLHSVACELRQ